MLETLKNIHAKIVLKAETLDWSEKHIIYAEVAVAVLVALIALMLITKSEIVRLLLAVAVGYFLNKIIKD